MFPRLGEFKVHASGESERRERPAGGRRPLEVNLDLAPLAGCGVLDRESKRERLEITIAPHADQHRYSCIAHRVEPQLVLGDYNVERAAVRRGARERADREGAGLGAPVLNLEVEEVSDRVVLDQVRHPARAQGAKLGRGAAGAQQFTRGCYLTVRWSGSVRGDLSLRTSASSCRSRAPSARATSRASHRALPGSTG